MNLPARRRTDADATSANQSNVTHIFCGKPDVVQPAALPPPRNRQKAVGARGFSFQSTVKPRAGMAELQRAATARARLPKADFVKRSGGIIPKNDRPVRGVVPRYGESRKCR